MSEGIMRSGSAIDVRMFGVSGGFREMLSASAKAKLLLILLLLISFTSLHAKEVIREHVVSLPTLELGDGALQKQISPEERLIVKKYLSALQSAKQIKLILRLNPSHGVINESTLVSVEIDNTAVFSGEKDLGNFKRFKVMASAKLMGRPSVSNVSPSKSKGGSRVTIYVPLYCVVMQSILTSDKSFTTTQNIEILNSLTVVIGD